MVVLSNGKMKMDKPRFRLNVKMNCSNLPNCLIKEDVIIVKDEDFNTIRDIAEYLGITYHIAVNIKNKKTETKGGKWMNSPLCPTITIEKINNN